ncbi:hypothetical protein E2C01_022789 [Portunus trituberculatus]|uniref:Uncharacterized protein n=1 Tax=Portunus trituberculatus TaxID=210409 RepID=A0A5B7E6Y9_PORTR|nr:hypothetical protein [Portunus trituberculatus]
MEVLKGSVTGMVLCAGDNLKQISDCYVVMSPYVKAGQQSGGCWRKGVKGEGQAQGAHGSRREVSRYLSSGFG